MEGMVLVMCRAEIIGDVPFGFRYVNIFMCYGTGLNLRRLLNVTRAL